MFIPTLLAGQVAVVTGGGTGIGLAIAKRLGELGARIVIGSRNSANLEQGAAELRHAGLDPLAVQIDVRKPEQVDEMVERTIKHFGHIDILVNNAAGNFICRAEELSPNGFGTVVDIDLKGTFNVCRAAFEQLKKTRGRILNISATLHYGGTPMQLHVSAAKAGVDALTRNLAVEWGAHGIRTNAIAPGPIEDTEGMSRLVPPDIRERLRKRIPIGRFGRIRDIEHCAVFLCSDAASYINGAVIAVDGGQWLNSPLA
jgi:2,4-dienoyl-CoA reductase [(3E)-enoyl-CoA-producing], peroxisomal